MGEGFDVYFAMRYQSPSLELVMREIEKKAYTESLGTARNLARKASGKKGRGIGAENLHWPILGTKPRYVNNGWGIKGNRIYVGRMKSTMPDFVIRHVTSSKSLLTTAFATGARKQLLKEAYK